MWVNCDGEKNKSYSSDYADLAHKKSRFICPSISLPSSLSPSFLYSFPTLTEEDIVLMIFKVIQIIVSSKT